MRKICVAVCAAIISIMGIVAFSNVATSAGTSTATADAMLATIAHLRQDEITKQNLAYQARKESPIFQWISKGFGSRYEEEEYEYGSGRQVAYAYMKSHPDLTTEEILSALEKQKALKKAYEEHQIAKKKLSVAVIVFVNSVIPDD